GDVLVDGGLERLVGEALIELRTVEPDVLRVLLQLVLAERALIREELRVVVPKLALRVGAVRRLGRRPRQRVHGERIVAEDETDLVAVGLHHLVDRILRALAERALVVGELDDRDGRLRAAALLRTSRRRDVDDRRTEEHRRLVLLLQLLDERLPSLLRLLLLQVLDDARLDLLERLAAELRLVLVVDLLDVRVARRGRLPRDLGLLE